MTNEAIDLIKKHEGFRQFPYKCTAGKMTIGYGRNIEDVGISKEEALFLLVGDVARCEQDLQSIFLQFDHFTRNRRVALIDMRYNLGPSRFRGFKRMLAAILADDWDRAADEAMDSEWYRQVKSRGPVIAGMLRGDI
ncbi:MAG: lysozyme [Desulfamplus sp.]|nr:lysozyme [Desulfamplus sp.]